MILAMPSLFDNLPTTSLPAELTDTLLSTAGCRVERIVSTGQASLVGFWYDQTEVEWVCLLKGSAGLRFEDEETFRVLRPGGWVLIEPHRRHRVEWTDAEGVTVWLAVFLRSDDGLRN